MHRCKPFSVACSAALAVFSIISGNLSHRIVNDRAAQTELAVRCGESRLHVFLEYHERDITLGGSLGDRDDIHILAAERVERAPGNARSTAHIFANDG